MFCDQAGEGSGVGEEMRGYCWNGIIMGLVAASRCCMVCYGTNSVRKGSLVRTRTDSEGIEATRTNTALPSSSHPPHRNDTLGTLCTSSTSPTPMARPSSATPSAHSTATPPSHPPSLRSRLAPPTSPTSPQLSSPLTPTRDYSMLLWGSTLLSFSTLAFILGTYTIILGPFLPPSPIPVRPSLPLSSFFTNERRGEEGIGNDSTRSTLQVFNRTERSSESLCGYY